MIDLLGKRNGSINNLISGYLSTAIELSVFSESTQQDSAGRISYQILEKSDIAVNPTENQ